MLDRQTRIIVMDNITISRESYTNNNFVTGGQVKDLCMCNIDAAYDT